MYLQTHLAATIFGIFLLSDFIEGKFVFAFVAIISTFLPDIDNARSYFGRKKIFRPLQSFIFHRGILHSFTFLFLITYLLSLWNHSISFVFLWGYGSHLFLDMFTVWGIRPLWPLRWKLRGKMRSGRGMEIFLFVFILILDVFLLFYKVLKIF